jgi:peptidoglycan/xylan/chitin deacetylase (PgdA/CDA1 family)
MLPRALLYTRGPLNERIANISIDFESIYHYSETLGLNHPDRDRDFARIVDRFLELFAELDVQATFFMVGDDVRLKKLAPEVLRQMVAAGHELANHTTTHPHNLSRLSRARKEEEITVTGRLLEDHTGQRVVGFRAPCLDVDEEVVEILERHGYWYESSVLPFYLKQAQEFAYGLMTNGRFRSTGDWRNSFAPGDPYVPAKGALHRRGSRPITEVPIATVPGVRFPFYSTIHFAFGRGSFDASYALVRRGRRQFTYELHSIDLADGVADGIEERYPGISRHPCLKQSAAHNADFLRYAIRRFQQDYTLKTMRDMIGPPPGTDANLLPAR